MGNQEKDHPLKDYYNDIYHSYDRINRIFTFGRDRHWRKQAVDECLRDNPVKILDLCTGTGDLILEIAEETNNSVQCTGYDFSSRMLQVARRKAEKRGRTIEFIEGEVAEMPFPDDHFDSVGITFGIRNLVYENSKAGKHLSEIYRVLKKNGKLVVLESGKPSNRIWRFFNGIYLRIILPYLGGAISGNLKAYKYLAESSRNYYTGDEMKEILQQAGFSVSRFRSLFFGSVMLVVAGKA